MKRLLSFLLGLCLFFSSAALANELKDGGTVLDKSASLDSNPEVQRAIGYGLVPENVWGGLDDSITYGEFCGMLTKVITLTDPTLQAPWPALDESLSKKLIDRQEAMLACMLAGLDMGLTNATDYAEEQNLLKGNADQSRGSLLYPDWQKPIQVTTFKNETWGWDDYIIAGVFYCMRQVSRKSGMPLFILENGDLRTSAYLTRQDAVLAAVRLFESIPRNYILANQPAYMPASSRPELEITSDFDVQRAIASGIIPDNIQHCWNDQITYRQFCTMLSRVIARMDPGLINRWEETARLALISDRKITRQEAMLALFYAADLLGAGDNGNRFLVNRDHSLDNPWDEILYDYPEFPNWRDLASFGTVRQDYITSAYFYCMNRFSMYSAKPVFECDSQINSMRVADPCTVEEAVKAAQRLMDSIVVLTAMNAAPANTVSMEAIEAGKHMPAVSPYSLPKWYGYAYALWDNPYVNEWRYFSENSIKQLHDLGFNFLRMVYHLEELFVEKDGEYLANLTTFKNLDEIITWCAKYGMHITVQMHQIPGLGGNGLYNVFDILENPVHYQQSLDIYDFISKRYANVPTNLLSFTLLSEPPLDYLSFEAHAKLVEDLAATIRRNSPDRLIMAAALHSDKGTAPGHWIDTFIKEPNYLLDPSIVQVESFYLFNRNSFASIFNGWPYKMAAVVSNMILPGNPPFTLKGNFKAGSEITFYVTAVHGVNPDAYLLCKAGNQELGRYPLTGFTEGVDNCEKVFLDNGSPCAYFGSNFNNNGLVITFKLTKKASSITLAIQGYGNCSVIMSDVMIKTPSDTEQNYIVVDKRFMPAGISYERGKFTSNIIHCDNILGMPNSTVTIKKDGTYTCKPIYKGKDVADIDSARDYFDMWEKWSKETGGSYFDFEFLSAISLPKEIRADYMRSVMELFKEYDIGWTFSADTTSGGGIILYKGAENMKEFNSDIPKLILPPDGGYSINDDYDYPCYYDDTVIAVMQEYMK